MANPCSPVQTMVWLASEFRDRADSAPAPHTNAEADQVEAAKDAFDLMLAALKECLKAEMERRAKLLPGAPATTYSEARITRVQAAISKAAGHADD